MTHTLAFSRTTLRQTLADLAFAQETQRAVVKVDGAAEELAGKPILWLGGGRVRAIGPAPIEPRRLFLRLALAEHGTFEVDAERRSIPPAQDLGPIEAAWPGDEEVEAMRAVVQGLGGLEGTLLVDLRVLSGEIDKMPFAAKHLVRMAEELGGVGRVLRESPYDEALTARVLGQLAALGVVRVAHAEAEQVTGWDVGGVRPAGRGASWSPWGELERQGWSDAPASRPPPTLRDSRPPSGVFDDEAQKPTAPGLAQHRGARRPSKVAVPDTWVDRRSSVPADAQTAWADFDDESLVRAVEEDDPETLHVRRDAEIARRAALQWAGEEEDDEEVKSSFHALDDDLRDTARMPATRQRDIPTLEVRAARREAITEETRPPRTSAPPRPSRQPRGPTRSLVPQSAAAREEPAPEPIEEAPLAPAPAAQEPDDDDAMLEQAGIASPWRTLAVVGLVVAVFVLALLVAPGKKPPAQAPIPPAPDPALAVTTPPPPPPPPVPTATVAAPPPEVAAVVEPPPPPIVRAVHVPVAGADADARVREAERLLVAQDYPAAERALSALKGSRPGDPSVWVLAAMLADDLDRQPQAMRDVDRALAIDPKNYRALALRGSLLQSRGQSREALAYYRKALALEPDHPMSPELRSVAKWLEARK